MTEQFKLVPHPIARDQVISTAPLRAGSSILSTFGFATILLGSEKGRRCDACFRLSNENRPLRRCSGCGSYWYCNTQCQNFQWKMHHKRLCKSYNSYIALPKYQALQDHEKLDSLLLSHVLAQLSLQANPYSFPESHPASTFLSLLPERRNFNKTPLICPMIPPPPKDLVDQLYMRFGNNNFSIHSHLTSIGHGIFPVASRLFNHSCVPNVAAKYTFCEAQSVVMEIIAFRDILPDDELCITYLDPALLQSKHQILELSYGFNCTCSSCRFIKRIDPIPELPTDSDELSTLGKQLRDFVGIDFQHGPSLPIRPIESTLPALYPVLHEEYLTRLSSTFSESSHQGQYDLAIDSGITLLSLYVLIYPSNYPQIGMHLLELAKTMWNARISSNNSDRDDDRISKVQVLTFLSLARNVLEIYGPEGDEIGPLDEIKTLDRLLAID